MRVSQICKDSLRTRARLETGDERYNRFKKTLFDGTGDRSETCVLMSLYALNRSHIARASFWYLSVQPLRLVAAFYRAL